MVLFIVLHDVCLAVSTKGTIEREESSKVWNGGGWNYLMPWITAETTTVSLYLTCLTAENTPVPNLYQRSLRLLYVQIRL